MNDMTLHAFAPPQGFYTSKPDHSDPDPSPFNFGSPTSPDPSSTTRPRRLSTNRGGRPKDFVWSFFAGDREKAVCRSCSWSTERPKAFRMRAHILVCPQMPDDVKESVKQAIDSKEQAQRVKEDASNRMGIVKTKKRKSDKISDINALPPSLRGIMDDPPSAVSTDVVSDPAPPHSLITCHVLDSTSGKPGAEMQVQLDHLTHSGYVSLAQSWTDADGRCNTLPIMPGMLEQNGTYRLTFHTGEYFKKLGIATFYPVVEITFITANASEPYHVPLLLSPFSYSTYRGS